MEGEERDAIDVAELVERLARAEDAAAARLELAELEEASTLLALALEPAVPRPAARRRLLAALPPKSPPLTLAPPPAALPFAAPAAAAAEGVDLADFVRREKRVVRALRFLVAALLLCLVGVVYLAARLDRQGAELKRQSAELGTVDRRLHMITSVARYAYRLEPTPVASLPAFSPQPEAPPQGMVYVCGHHQQWILSLEHLPPPPPGREYHIRFRTATGTIDGGVLRVDAEARAGMEDVKLPPGTRGFSVTLEPVGSAGDPLLVLQSQPGVPL